MKTKNRRIFIIPNKYSFVTLSFPFGIIALKIRGDLLLEHGARGAGVLRFECPDNELDVFGRRAGLDEPRAELDHFLAHDLGARDDKFRLFIFGDLLFANCDDVVVVESSHAGFFRIFADTKTAKISNRRYAPTRSASAASNANIGTNVLPAAAHRQSGGNKVGPRNDEINQKDKSRRCAS